MREHLNITTVVDHPWEHLNITTVVDLQWERLRITTVAYHHMVAPHRITVAEYLWEFQWVYLLTLMVITMEHQALLPEWFLLEEQRCMACTNSRKTRNTRNTRRIRRKRR